MDILQEWTGIIGIATAFGSFILGKIGVLIGGAGGVVIAGLCEATLSLSAVILSLAPRQGLAILKKLFNLGIVSQLAFNEIRSRIPIGEPFQQY